ncbi:hypothetical protein lerEdw1_014198, partial [Lerista edwardsae]
YFSVLSESLLQDLIASRLVLPNRITIPLKKNINIAQLRFPIPCGVVRVYLLEAESLVQKDNFLGAIRGKSDPYAVLRVGVTQFRSKTIQRDLNPIWNEMFEFVVHEIPGQDLEVDLYDEDPDKDDFLGSLLISLADVMKDRVVEEDKNGLATAILIVYLDSAFNLPRNQFEYSNGEYDARKYRKDRYLKKAERDPCSFVLLTVGSKTQKSKTCKFTKDPVWGQAFTFFVHSAPSQSLHLEVSFLLLPRSVTQLWFLAESDGVGSSPPCVPFLCQITTRGQVKDKDRENALGTLVISLARLLKNSEMTLEENFQLDHSGSGSSIKMKVVLRALGIEEPDPDSSYKGVKALKQVPIPATEDDGNQGKTHLPPPPPPPPPPPLPSKTEVAKAPQVSKDSDVLESQGDRRESHANLNVNENWTGPVVKEAAAKINEQTGPGYVDSKFLAPPTIPTPLTSPALRRAQLAPSIASLASSHFDVTCSNLDLINGTLPAGMPMGEIHLTVRYASLRQSLVVLVNGCRNLMPCSLQGAHPYVRVYLLPDKRWAARRRTTVKKRTLNPNYDEKFEFFETLEGVKKRALDVAVKNRRSFISHERHELGKVRC